MSETEEGVANIVIPYTPRPWQREMHQNLKRFNVLVVHRGAGKGLALDTLIATPDGFTMMGDIRLGDTVIDRDGRPCLVTKVSDVHHLPCYEVEFSSGEKFVCDESHLWLTQSGNERDVENYRKRPRNRKPNPQNRNNKRGFTAPIESEKSIIEIANTLEDGSQKNHRVRVALTIQFPERNLPIDPYVMGYWLGDGTSRNAQVTVGSQDRDAFLFQMMSLGMEAAKVPASPMQYRLGVDGRLSGNREVCVKTKLRLLGVLGNKHIPIMYLRSSEAQRWRLLQGLMDSDGSVNKTGGKCEISLTNRRLTEDVRELIASLGLRPWNLVTSRASIGGKDVGEKYRTGFKAYKEHPVFAFARKQDRLPDRAKHGYQRNRMIVAVTPVHSVPTKCIEVDSPTHTYCIGRSFIPTHNSVFAMNELIMRALRGPPWAEYVYLLPLRNQAQRIVWVPMKRFTDPIPGVAYNNTTLEIVLPNKAKIMILGADDPDKLRGLHLHGIVLDEFADMVPRTWMVVRPMLTNHQGWVVWIGTPKGHNAFYDKYIQSQNPEWDDWMGEILPYWKTNALPLIEVDRMRAEMLPEEFAQEMEVSFESALVGAYYSKQLHELRDTGRVTTEKLFREDLEVHTAWDLGIRDRMSVWWFQLQGRPGQKEPDIVFIDFEENSNWGFAEWAEVVKSKERNYNYRYGLHIAPHDIKNRELGTGVSRLESAEQVGIYFQVCPKQDVMDGIELVRRHFHRFKFHAQMCEDGLESLAMYRAKVDKMGQGLGPEHSVWSHASDSLRYCVTHVVQVMEQPALMRLPFLRTRR